MKLFLHEYIKSKDFELSLINEIKKTIFLQDEEIKICRDENGKPNLNIKDLHIGFSHSKNRIIFGYSKIKFGIDIENIRNISHFGDRFFKKVLTEEEYKFLFYESKSFNRDFIKIWTKKEAYLKYLGIGIRTYLNKINSFNLVDIYTFEIEDFIISIFIGRCNERQSLSSLTSHE